MKFKESLAIILSVALVYTSCDQVKKNTPSQKPAVSTAASKKQIEESEKKIAQEGQGLGDALSEGTNSLKGAKMNLAVSNLIAQGDMYIKDYEGNDVSTESYKLNPSQYFMIYKNKGQDSYRVINSSAGQGSSNGFSQVKEDFHLAYKFYNYDGDIQSFHGSLLSEPVHKDAVDLTATASASFNNKTEVNSFIDRIQNSNELAMNAGFSDQLSELVFPTAHADWDQKDSYLTVAIIFTAVALISYLFSWRSFGNISVAVAIVFWFLYWFYED